MKIPKVLLETPFNPEKPPNLISKTSTPPVEIRTSNRNTQKSETRDPGAGSLEPGGQGWLPYPCGPPPLLLLMGPRARPASQLYLRPIQSILPNYTAAPKICGRGKAPMSCIGGGGAKSQPHPSL
ncbi:hypothetical protein HJG60_012046 [Phyllostomus discolor]|uniref:Uncharacterized protein n=1 Tax=Phyllostomus discolor TaxID=89673 RepID=A0A833ZEN7_9CHIR|nr:hypothetical protein HJG60_012046 [Phyllostomus discolor]